MTREEIEQAARAAAADRYWHLCDICMSSVFSVGRKVLRRVGTGGGDATAGPMYKGVATFIRNNRRRASASRTE